MSRVRHHMERDIAALADGSYEAPGLREQIAASPELTALLDEQRRAVAATRAARPTASAALRAAVAAGAAPRAAVRPRRPMLGVAVAASGVIALAVSALLPSSGAGPSVTAMAALAVRGPAGPGPVIDPAHGDDLQSQVDGVRYPNWQDAFGWRSTGSRTDQVGGRRAMTVFYANPAGATVGYTIVAGAPLPEPAGGGGGGRGATTTQFSGATRFVGLMSGGRTIVTWRRAGHTCVISASGVPEASLLRLAEWRYDATPA